MIVTYLVGNGFDAALNLDTSAQSIVSSFVRENLPNKETNHASAAEKLAIEISGAGIENWADFEMKFGEYSLRFSDKAYGDKEDYLKAYELFILHLHKELTQEYERFSEHEIAAANAQKCMTSLKDIPEALQPAEAQAIKALRKGHESEHWEYNIVTFNYTNTIDDMFNILRKSGRNIGDVDGAGRKHMLGELIHAHETLDKLLICGLDCPEQILYEPFRNDDEVCQTIVKDYSQRYYASNSDILSFDLISKSRILCIFGMSLGSSDGRWWRAILNQLEKDSQSLVVIFSYELSNTAFHSTTEYRRIKERLLTKLDEGAGASCTVNFKDVKDRVFIASSSSIFPLEEKLEDKTDG